MYNNDYPSNYDEIKTYYPVDYREFFEIDCILRHNGWRLDGIQTGIVEAVMSIFAHKADAATISQWEEFLEIPYDPARTIGERKQVVLSFFRGKGHIGEKEIKEIVACFTSTECGVTFDDGVIGVTLLKDPNTDSRTAATCYHILCKKIPAHLELWMTLFEEINVPVYVGLTISNYQEIELNGPDYKEEKIGSRLYVGISENNYREEVLG